MKIISPFILLTIFCLWMQLSPAQSPAYAWAVRIGADTTDYGEDITTDATGNIYATGACAGTVDFDPGSGTYTLGPAGGNANPDASNIYISKMDASGNLLWAKRIGNSSNYSFANGGLSVSVDLSGNVYVMGFFEGTVDFDPGPGVYNISNSNPGPWCGIFILELDVSGNFIWAKNLTGNYSNGFATDMVLDANNNIFLTGWFRGQIDMDPGLGVVSFTSDPGASFFSSFILKLDAGGNFVFAKQLRQGVGSSETMGHGIELDASGNIYSCGNFNGTVDFDPGPGTYTFTTATYIAHNYILKLDPSGNFIWAAQIGGAFGYSSALAIKGNCIYNTGAFKGTADFDPGAGVYTLTATGNNTVYTLQQNQYMLKLDLAGNFLWVKNLESTLFSFGTSLALDAGSNVYGVGEFQGSADFDPGPGTLSITSNGGWGTFIIKLDPSGNLVWAKTIDGGPENWASAIHVTSASDIFMTGSLRLTADFDPGPGIANLNSAGEEDIYISKWTQCSGAVFPVDITPPPLKLICENTGASLSTSCDNPPSWYSSLTSTLILGTGTNYISPPLAPGSYTFYAGEETCLNSGRIAITVTVAVCTGLESSTKNETHLFEVYPNPSSDGLVKVSTGSFENGCVLEVLTLQGVLVTQINIWSEITELDLGKQPGGMYLIKLKKEGSVLSVRKILRQ